jgi:hypothetical protein
VRQALLPILRLLRVPGSYRDAKRRVVRSRSPTALRRLSGAALSLSRNLAVSRRNSGGGCFATRTVGPIQAVPRVDSRMKGEGVLPCLI